MIGWEEIARADAPPTSIVQHWHDPDARAARGASRAQGDHVAGARTAYLDMKYTPERRSA